MHAHKHFYRKHIKTHIKKIFFLQVFRLNSKLDKMQNLFVFGEINKYLDTQIIEIEAQPFWNPDNQEIKFHNLANVSELSDYPRDGMFEDMEEFQIYKTLCFMTNYQNKQLNKLVHLRDIYAIKCKLSMLCTSTMKWGIPFNTVCTSSLPWIVTEDYSVNMLQSMNYHHNWPNPALCCDPFSNTERDDIYFIKLDIAIHIQENMINNIYEKLGSFPWIFPDYKEIIKRSNDTMDYNKILNKIERIIENFY